MSLPTLPPDAGVLTRVRLAARCLLVLKDDPGDTHHAVLFNSCMDRETYTALAETWRRDDRQQLLDERPSLQRADLDLDRLRDLPDGTFGRALAAYFDDLGIEPFVSDYPIDSDADWLARRYRETHDLLHVLTGYGIDDYAEMELQAFVYGNQGLRQNLFILCAGVLRLLPQLGPWGLRHYLSDVRRAYRRGRASADLLGFRYEAVFDAPLEQVRRDRVAPQGDRRPSPLAAVPTAV